MRVFLSYAGRDRDLAKQVALMIASTLERCDSTAEVYWAPAGNTLSSDWELEMAEKLRLCDAIVVLWARPNNVSFGQALEVGAGWILGKPILTVMRDCDSNDLPGAVLSRRQAVGWFSFREAFERFAREWKEAGIS